MNLHTYSAADIASKPLPGPSAVIRMADSAGLFAPIHDAKNVLAQLDLVFNDAGENFGLVRAPTDGDAGEILKFVAQHRDAPNIVFQCQVGVGRSLAACAAIQKLYGWDPRPALERGTHNRNLYRRILLAAGVAPEREELVSMIVRVKYPADRLLAFYLSMRRQRYDNWELIFLTDGANAEAVDVVGRFQDPRVQLIQTERALGRWGHPYRQRGIEASKGSYVGLSNDDNYYVPGYIEQMVNALVRNSALLALSPMLHSNWAWRYMEAGHDVGSWIAHRDLIQRTPWSGDEYLSDAHYMAMLKRNAGDRITVLDRPLFVHN